MSPITAAARRTVGKPIGECTAEDLDRIIADGKARIAELTEDRAEARAERDRRNQL